MLLRRGNKKEKSEDFGGNAESRRLFPFTVFSSPFFFFFPLHVSLFSSATLFQWTRFHGNHSLSSSWWDFGKMEVAVLFARV